MHALKEKRMAEHNVPHPKNVAGDFYVVDQCCTACGVPTHLAPETFSFVNGRHGDHCYVHRQPTRPEEVDRVLRVIRCQEIECIRYRGADPVILRRLTEAGAGDACDAPLPAGIHPVVRNHTSIEAQSLDARAWASPSVLERFRHWLMGHSPSYRTTPVMTSASGASFSFSWTENSFHEVTAKPVGDAPSRWLLQHSGNITVSEIIEEWLESECDLGAVQWYSQEEWERGSPGQLHPW
ncbi:ferredoxin [Myxococcus sp. Y35]|uniref:ferredoxin n=1 Tax=Pseudomyxococcus flavus TaxID=3115648 RepID=UPI003CFAEF9E